MAKLEVEINLDTEALIRELKKASEKIEAEKESGDRPDRSRDYMTCPTCDGTGIMTCPTCGGAGIKLKMAAEKIEAEKESGDRPDRWIFDWRGMTCSKCCTTFSEELMYMNRENAINWVPEFCPECGARLGYNKEASE